jgi:hypothetical protein
MRGVICVVALAACTGAPRAPTPPAKVHRAGPMGWEPSHAEIIDDVLAREGERLRAVPGVLVVERGTARGEDVLHIAACDRAQLPQLRLEQIEVPVYVEGVNGSGYGKECGCDWKGTYYEPGAHHFPCNDYSCAQGTWTQESEGGCEIQIADTITFDAKSATLSETARAVVTSLVPTFRDHADLFVAVHGSRTRKEPTALAMQRAKAVVDALVAAGVSADQLTALDDGDTGRAVELQVLVQPAQDEP